MENNERPTMDDLKEINARVEAQKAEKTRVIAMEKGEQDYSNNIEKMLEKYTHLPKSDMPHEGRLYPENWELYYRCPTVDEVAIYSTIPDDDYFKIMLAHIALIRKCFLILNGETGQQINTENLKSAHKMFYFLKLRSFYMNQEPIKLPIYSVEIEEALEIEFNEYGLRYDEFTDELFDEYYDANSGTFTFNEEEIDEPIVIGISNFGMEVKTINFIQNNYKKMQSNETKKKNFDNFDKTFMAFIPYLFVTGQESVESLKHKFREVQKNDEKMKFYMEFMNSFSFGEKDTVTYQVEREGELIEGRTPMKFPNGLKGLFVRETLKSRFIK